MANTDLTIDQITKEALMILHNNLSFSKNVDKQYDSSFAQSGAKIGSSLRIRKPVQFEVSSGAGLNVQDVTETSTTLTIDQQKHIDFQFTSEELTLDIDDFSNRYLKPAMARLASQVDFDGLTQYQNVYSSEGTPGTAPATAAAYLDSAKKLDDYGTPRDGFRNSIVNPAAMAASVDGIKGLENPGNIIGKNFINGAMSGTQLGLNILEMSQNVNVHTTGAFSGSVLVNDTVAEGDAVISLDTFTDSAPTVKKGDVFTIDGVNQVNPETKQDTGVLQQFVVTANKTGSSNAIADIAVSPSFIATGATKTITALPSDGDAITFKGTASTAYPQNMVYHRDAFTLGTADLILPGGVDMASRQTFDGISLRAVRQYDINNDNMPIRIDVLYGWATQRPELACRLWG